MKQEKKNVEVVAQKLKPALIEAINLRNEEARKMQAILDQ